MWANLTHCSTCSPNCFFSTALLYSHVWLTFIDPWGWPSKPSFALTLTNMTWLPWPMSWQGSWQILLSLCLSLSVCLSLSLALSLSLSFSLSLSLCLSLSLSLSLFSLSLHVLVSSTCTTWKAWCLLFSSSVFGVSVVPWWWQQTEAIILAFSRPVFA